MCELLVATLATLTTALTAHGFIEGVQLPSDESTTVPLIGGVHPVVEATANGQAGRWRIDTGWTPSVMARSVANRAGVPPLDILPSPFDRTGNQHSAVRRVDDFRIGPIQLDAATLLDFDLTPMSRGLGVRITGMLGFDALAHVPVSLDFAAQSFTWHDPTTFTPPESATATTLTLFTICPACKFGSMTSKRSR